MKENNWKVGTKEKPGQLNYNWQLRRIEEEMKESNKVRAQELNPVAIGSREKFVGWRVS